MQEKIAIATWYTNGNYGGTLQAYALQNVLKDIGYESEFINLCEETNSISYKIKRAVKDIAIFSYKPKFYISRLKIFKFVKENLNISEPYYTYNQLRECADKKYIAAICGSDQIWANVGNKIDDLSYLTFINPNKRISYAPSTGYNRISEELRPKFKEYINNIKFLSVREKQGAEFIENITGKRPNVVLDPSLLLTITRWTEIIKDNVKKVEEDKYIFCYFLGKNKEYINYAKRLSKETGCKLIGLEAKHLSQNGVKKITADPFEFLDYILNASYVLTDSFHGVCFSINLGKKFGVFKRFSDDDPKNQNSRILNILEKVRLENRLIDPKNRVNELIDDRIDFELVQSLLDRERSESLEYLKNAIKEAVN